MPNAIADLELGCYDLLHQRQGRRDAGQDPSAAVARPARTVEGYEQ